MRIVKLSLFRTTLSSSMGEHRAAEYLEAFVVNNTDFRVGLIDHLLSKKEQAKWRPCIELGLHLSLLASVQRSGASLQARVLVLQRLPRLPRLPLHLRRALASLAGAIRYSLIVVQTRHALNRKRYSEPTFDAININHESVISKTTNSFH